VGVGSDNARTTAHCDCPLTMTIRVMHVGLGPIGAAVAQQLAVRRGFRIVAAVDVDPHKIGRDVSDVAELGGPIRVRVTSDLRKAAKATKPDIAVLCTSSSLKSVMPQLEELLRLRLPVVSTTEELAYPAPRNRRLARRLDQMARRAKVAVLGTGVNPGFAMDVLPIALTSVCEQINHIEVRRVQDARTRRLPFQQKIGAGLTREQFEQQVRSGLVRHVGFTESIQMIGDAMGWTLTRITDEVRPWIAEDEVHSELLAVDPGYVAGISQEGVGWVGDDTKIRLQLDAYLGAPESFDSVLIDGSPRIYSKVQGGIHGDIATASMTVNSIPHVLTAAPGLRTMRDMPLPSFYAAR
jgi:2,4-diaminopentanoate dehydrogenase